MKTGDQGGGCLVILPLLWGEVSLFWLCINCHDGTICLLVRVVIVDGHPKKHCVWIGVREDGCVEPHVNSQFPLSLRLPRKSG